MFVFLIKAPTAPQRGEDGKSLVSLGIPGTGLGERERERSELSSPLLPSPSPHPASGRTQNQRPAGGPRCGAFPARGSAGAAPSPARAGPPLPGRGGGRGGCREARERGGERRYRGRGSAVPAGRGTAASAAAGPPALPGKCLPPLQRGAPGGKLPLPTSAPAAGFLREMPVPARAPRRCRRPQRWPSAPGLP